MLSEHPKLVEQIQTHLATHAEGVTEHQLIKLLDDSGAFNGWISGDPTLGLFQKHFAVMHCLYRLQAEYLRQGQELCISPVDIRLADATAASANSQLSNGVGLHGYYLDWGNFTAATVDTVSDLLRNFWRAYTAEDKTAAAFQTLGLEVGADWSQIQARYRRLAIEHHPDKGGDPVAFAQMREAYEVLKTRING